MPPIASWVLCLKDMLEAMEFTPCSLSASTSVESKPVGMAQKANIAKSRYPKNTRVENAPWIA